MSVQYRGWKETEFDKLAFSTKDSVKRAINTLQLNKNLAQLGLPDDVSPEHVFRSSFGYLNTIEVLFPTCDGRGASDHSFRMLNNRLLVDASELEDMQINTLFIYFLPDNRTKLDWETPANFVFKRPYGGWKPPLRRAGSPHTRARSPPRGPARAGSSWRPRFRSQSSSSSTRDSPYGSYTPLTSARASSTIASSRQPSAEPVQRVTVEEILRPSRTSPCPLPTDETPEVRSEPMTRLVSSPSSVHHSLKSPSTSTIPLGDASQTSSHVSPPVGSRKEDADLHRDERASLRAQLEANEAERELQRKQIRQLQQELAIEREARRDAEARLEKERARLEEERQRIRDIQMECREPLPGSSMGKKPGPSYQPETGVSFNIIMSIQYRGWKERRFSNSLFSSDAGVERAMEVLELRRDLACLDLPDDVNPRMVFRSSYGYANTIEILFTGCEGKGIVERKFRSLNQRLQEDPIGLESMQIRTLYVYFLPKQTTRLHETSASTFVFRRPLSGWTDHPTPRRRSPGRRARTPPRARLPARRASSASPLHSSGEPSKLDSMVLQRTTTSPSHASLVMGEMVNTIGRAERSSAVSGPSLPDGDQTRIVRETGADRDAPVLMKPEIPVVKGLQEDEAASLRAKIEQSEALRQIQSRQIHELEEELTLEREGRRHIETRLEEERVRVERECTKLQELRREGWDPYFGPALLDAFQVVSDMAREVV
ncbi:unnamed protein product [Peniophora sp. CBMAI 1063]|nr:unnamed protein product [Peniophora sp. CBMAI 1063]